MSIHPTLLKTLNVLSFFVIASAGAIYGRDVAKVYLRPHLLQTELWGYGAAMLVSVLATGFPIVQWLDDAHDVVVEAISWRFFVSNIVHAFWYLAWARGWLVLAQIAIVLNFILIWRIYTKMRVFTSTNLFTYACIQVFFSMYATVNWVDQFQTFFTAFTDDIPSDGLITALAVGSLLTMLALGWYQAELSSDPDSWSAATLIFYFYAIVSYQSHQEQPSYSIIVTGLLCLGFLFNSFARRGIRNIAIQWERNNDNIIANGESRALLGSRV